MRTSAFAFARDLRDEGVEAVLDNVRHRGRLDGVGLAVAYHDGRDVFPHNPRSRVGLLESGAIFFAPDPAVWVASELQPRVSELVQDGDPLAELLGRAAPLGLDVHAWTVFLHNDELARRAPACAQENAFGDRDPGTLCPAQPAVRDYVRRLVTDLAARRVTGIVAESLHYHPLEHGHAHERYPVEIGALGRLLLGLCFCPACCKAAEALGVDAAAVRAFACATVDQRFASGAAVDDSDAELARDAVGALVEGALGDYLGMRETVVATLVAEAVASAGAVPICFLDASGAAKGYWTGRPTGGSAASIAWRFGVELEAIAGAGAGILALAYAADPGRVAFDLDDYAARAPEAALACVLRPNRPDSETVQDLVAKLRVARSRGVETVHVYHYGLIRLEELDRIGFALEELEPRQS